MDQTLPSQTSTPNPFWDRIRNLPEPAKWFLAWLLVFGAFLLAQYDNLNAPYFWDAIGYVVPHAIDILNNHFNPILKTYDVGHPTGFFFLMALMMKLFGGPSPLPGHVLICAFDAIFLLAVFAMGRRFGLPPVWSAAVAILFFLHPLVWAQSRRVLLDLPMSALILWSYLLWSRGRRVPYMLVGGVATLFKLYGFALVLGPATALLFTSGRFWQKDSRKTFLVDMAWALSPVLFFLGFLAVRIGVRGNLHAQVNHTTGNTLHPIWKLEDWLATFPAAWRTLVYLINLEWFLGIFAVTATIWAIVRKRTGRDRLLASPEDRRLALAVLFLALAFNGMFFQLGGPVARYNLPVLAGVIVGLAAVLYALVRVRWVLAVLAVATGALFVLRWTPEHTRWLPESIRLLIERPAILSCSESTYDLRYEEYVEQMNWALDKVWEDAEERGVEPVLATHWPVNVAAGVPALGYVDRPIPNVTASSWATVDPTQANYVLFIEPIYWFSDVPDQQRILLDRRGERIKLASRAQVWYVWAPAN